MGAYQEGRPYQGRLVGLEEEAVAAVAHIQNLEGLEVEGLAEAEEVVEEVEGNPC